MLRIYFVPHATLLYGSFTVFCFMGLILWKQIKLVQVYIFCHTAKLQKHFDQDTIRHS